MRILITGAGGQLGSALVAKLEDDPDCDVAGADLPDFNLTDASGVRRTISDFRPTAVVNTAAYTLVDQAEEEHDRCAAINEHAVATLVEACDEIGATLCQLSTDYVFGDDAERSIPYVEDDIVGPINFYGRTKAASEQNAHHAAKHLIIRT